MTRPRWVGFQFLTESTDRGPQELQRFDVMRLSPNFVSQPTLCHEPAGIQD
jgi:hypothetical protein